MNFFDNDTNFFLNTFLNVNIGKLLFLIIYSPSFPFFLTFHTIFICRKLRPFLRKRYWLLNLILTTLNTVAGGTIVSYMICKKPKWLYSNKEIPLIIIIWYLINFSPFDLFYKITNLSFFQFFINIFEITNRIKSIFTYIDLVIEEIPGSYVASILTGYLIGIGGTLVYGLIIKILEPNKYDPQIMNELSYPGWCSKSSFLISLFYYLGTDPNISILNISKEDLKIIIMTYFVIYEMFLQTKLPLADIFSLPINLFFFLTKIPRSSPKLTTGYNKFSINLESDVDFPEKELETKKLELTKLKKELLFKDKIF